MATGLLLTLIREQTGLAREGTLAFTFRQAMEWLLTLGMDQLRLSTLRGWPYWMAWPIAYGVSAVEYGLAFALFYLCRVGLKLVIRGRNV